MSHALPNIGKVATKALQTIDDTQLEEVAARDQMYSKIWFDQLATHHEVTFIPDDLLFIQPELRELSPTIQLDLDRYILIETYQPIEVIQEEIDAYKQFVKYMNTEYGVDVVFLPYK